MTTSSWARCARVLGLLLVLLCGGAAAADDPAAYKAHAKKGQVYFNSGQYQKAIEEFQIAYEARPEPLLLWNLAQAHRHLGHAREALTLYERYLRLVPGSELRAETEGYMAELRAALEADRARAAEREQTEADRARAAEAKAPPAEKAEKAPEPAKLAPPVLVPVPPPQKEARRRPLRTAAWVLGAAGLLAAAGGAVLLGLDGMQTCDRESPRQKYCPYALDTMVPGAVALAAGGALLGTSGVLLGVDYRQTRGERVALLSLSGRF